MSKVDNLSRTLLFKVFANEVRLKIVEALSKADKSVGELCEETGEHQTRVSHELRCLTVCGCVSFRREGKRVVYSLNKASILPILRAADRHVEKYGSSMRGCSTVSDVKRLSVHAVAV